ncbi:MAG: tyrosine-type recombinase/integrase [Desulfobacterales bacterium]|nr:tyrosine-type recombinase/integrase [Desulfobacterales bacterium]
MKTEQAINEFLDSRISNPNLSDLTVPWYQPKLQRFARVCPKLPKDRKPIETFLATINSSPATNLNYFNALRAFFRFISDRHDIRNPMARMHAPHSKKKGRRATLEPAEEMRLLESVPESNLRDRAILTLFVDSGIRSSELAGLRPQDIGMETIYVSGKTGDREVPISEETRKLLFLTIARHGKSDYVFYGHKGPLTRNGIYRIVSAYMRKAGIQRPKVGPHRVRHAFGKGYLVNGGDLRSLQLLMGHANISTTQVYADLAIHDIIAKHHQFTPLRAAHAAAQESFLDRVKAVEEAEAILKESTDEPEGISGN